MNRSSSIILLACCAVRAQAPPESRFFSEASRATRSLAESTARSPRNLLTHCEQSNFLETGRQQEALDWARDSAVRWGFFDTVFEPKEYFSSYIMEPIARRMLERDPALRREFEERLQSDPRFAASSRDRLNFFYQRSPYADPDRDRYPVLRVMRLEKS